jgi:phosphatidylglycerophosphate synthase
VLDRRLRALTDAPLRALAARAAPAGLRAGQVTAFGFVVGVGACVAIALDHRWLALGLWLVNRAADGFDGAIARRVGATDLGGYLDLVADFAIYAGFVVGVAVAHPATRLAAVVLLGAYYVSGVAFLAGSAIAERRGRERGDNRSLHFVGGVAEGAETIVVYVLVCAWPSATAAILWVFSAAVGVTAVQRVAYVWRWFSAHDSSPGPGIGEGRAPAR